ncbi:MAG: hypothetical protein GC182_16315 [Rhodopseudomonas sp.]|nr:hypothetical protein [Rhodopseudomonas sp.]
MNRSDLPISQAPEPTSLIPSLQADALTQEIERQLNEEGDAVLASARTDARAIVAQARVSARQKLRGAIADLRREGERRLTRASAELDTAARNREQRQASRALEAAWPLLHETLTARWRDLAARKVWTDKIAALCSSRLRPGPWTVEHPHDWSAADQAGFVAGFANQDGLVLTFTADPAIAAGLRVTADQAVLDATVAGLLYDNRAIAALLLDALAQGSAQSTTEGLPHE